MANDEGTILYHLLDAERAKQTLHNILEKFIKESYMIEDIPVQDIPESAFDVHKTFITRDEISIGDVKELVHNLQSNRPELRDRAGLNVRVGKYIAPKGGPEIRTRLKNLLRESEDKHPYLTHLEYETLHPFTDGNGRSGRALFLRQCFKLHQYHDILYSIAGIGFLHTWYYLSLKTSRSNQNDDSDA